MSLRHVNGMDGMTELQALSSYRGITMGLPETIDGTTGPRESKEAGFVEHQLAEWQDLLDEVRDHLGGDASNHAREFMAAEQSRIDALRGA
jgi:hypothetical protein